MARKKMFSESDKLKMVELYNSGLSLKEVGDTFSITMASVLNILKKKGIKTRSKSEGNVLKWQNDEFRENQINKKKGKSSGALGKNWEVSKIVKRPNNTGENNPNWRGGKTKLSFQIRNSVEYSFWRMSVFKRDFFTCQHCGAKNKKGEKYVFDADHIYPFSKILDDFNITSIEEAVSCEKLWDIENGRTLCRDCHIKTDTYGVKRIKND